MEYLTSIEARSEENLDTRIWVPIQISGTQGSHIDMAEMEVNKVGKQVRFQGRSFHVYPIGEDASLSLTSSVEYDTWEISEEARESLGAHTGDHALIKWEEDEEGRYHPDTAESVCQAEFGEFVRHKNGDVSFVRRARKIVLGDKVQSIENYQIGDVIALLRPAQ